MSHHGDHDPDQKKNLHEIVANLNDNEKSQLKGILAKSDNSMDIAKGGPTENEQQAVSQRAEEETQHQDVDMGQPDGELDSDQIAKDMLDSKFSRGGPTKPRNLHERVQMNMASNLKSKGKL